MRQKQQPMMVEPVLIVQTIRSTWTKVSRGVPGAIARNTVPECLPISLPKMDLKDLQVLYHEVAFDEATGFQSPMESIYINPTIYPQYGCTTVERIEREVHITYRYNSGIGGVPYRSVKRHTIRAGVGNWLQMCENGRFSPAWEGDWWYQKIVVNAGLFNNVVAGHFLNTSPIQVFSAMADLW
jgi:hypothetical protein